MDFRDCRSGKVVLVPHCALNQNARLAGCAERPAAVAELVRGLMARDIGVLQMPCPEMMVIGLDREDVNIYQTLDTRSARTVCRRLARDLCYQIRQYRRCGVEVLGVLGKNGSPACGVEQTWRQGLAPGMGVFIAELAAELKKQEVPLQVVGTLDADPAAALAVVDKWSAPPAQADEADDAATQ